MTLLSELRNFKVVLTTRASGNLIACFHVESTLE